MKTLKLFVSGIVQGVFFRKSIENEAKKLELKGFVRNLDDGRVEIVVEGKDENVNEMVKICKQGPSHSEIKDVVTEEIRNQSFKEFKVFKGF